MEIYVWLSNKFGVDIFPDKVIINTNTNTNTNINANINTNTNTYTYTYTNKSLCEDEIKKLNIIITDALKRFNLSKKELNKRKKQEKMMIKNEKKIVELLDS
jgi:uncharacterized Fe-S cluster-containing protein